MLRKGVFAIAQKGRNPLREYAWKKEEQPEVLQTPHPSRQEEKGSKGRSVGGGGDKRTMNHRVLQVPAGTGSLQRTKAAQSTAAGGLPTHQLCRGDPSR